MTWIYEITSEKMVVWDHNGDKIEERENDGSGFVVPDDIFNIMRTEAQESRSNGSLDRWRDIYIRLADNDIEPKS